MAINSDKMLPSLLALVFNVCLLFNFMHITNSINDNSILQLSVYPHYGFSTENIEIRCQILQASRYDNVYLFVKTDYVKPSGILLMVDNTMNQCRINKEKYIHVHTCNSSMILIHVNHVVLNDSLHTIDYACNQGEVNVYSSYRIIKDHKARYSDPKSSNLSSSLTHTLFLLLFGLLITTMNPLVIK